MVSGSSAVFIYVKSSSRQYETIFGDFHFSEFCFAEMDEKLCVYKSYAFCHLFYVFLHVRPTNSLSILALATGTEGLNTINFTNSVSWLCPDKFLLAQYVKM